MISNENMEWIEGIVADERFMNRTPAEQSVMDMLLAEVKLYRPQNETSQASSCYTVQICAKCGGMKETPYVTFSKMDLVCECRS